MFFAMKFIQKRDVISKKTTIHKYPDCFWENDKMLSTRFVSKAF